MIPKRSNIFKMPAVIFIINSNLRGKMIDFVKDYLMMAVKVVTGFNPT